jgi:hypothetical protein
VIVLSCVWHLEGELDTAFEKARFLPGYGYESEFFRIAVSYPAKLCKPPSSFAGLERPATHSCFPLPTPVVTLADSVLDDNLPQADGIHPSALAAGVLQTDNLTPFTMHRGVLLTQKNIRNKYFKTSM